MKFFKKKKNLPVPLVDTLQRGMDDRDVNSGEAWVKRKLKTRKCLSCDSEFLSMGNRICAHCHRVHEALFRSYGFSGNYQECVYDISPEEGDPSPTGGEGLSRG